jgi:dTMP kinase
MPRPPFIALDGLDGTGKSTQCRLLADWLREQGWPVTECADPGNTSIGDILRGLLLDRRRDMSLACEAFLFMASRAELVSKVIRPSLEAGRIVVSDRFLLANVVYQGYAGGLDADQLWQIGHLATGGLEPDLTLVLDLPVSAALQRRSGAEDRMESRDSPYHERVRAGFRTEALRNPERIHIIDAGGSIAEIQQRIRQEVAGVLATCSRS